ncbi:MAG: ferredoxin [Actinomycetes bacterium]
MRIRLDANACVGHGRCYTLAPAHFEPDEIGHCVVVTAECSDAEFAHVRRAVDACPEGALTIED